MNPTDQSGHCSADSGVYFTVIYYYHHILLVASGIDTGHRHMS